MKADNQEITNSTLVTYASKHGSTAEIASRIGEVLQQAGLPVAVHPVSEVRDLKPYQSVILGSGVYMGQWCRSAAAFITANEQVFADRKVWLFSSGPTSERNPDQAQFTFPARLLPIVNRIQPVERIIFHGYIDPRKLNLKEKAIIKMVNVPQGDFRDWDAISDWSRKIANTVIGVEK